MWDSVLSTWMSHCKRASVYIWDCLLCGMECVCVKTTSVVPLTHASLFDCFLVLVLPCSIFFFTWEPFCFSSPVLLFTPPSEVCLVWTCKVPRPVGKDGQGTSSEGTGGGRLRRAAATLRFARTRFGFRKPRNLGLFGLPGLPIVSAALPSGAHEKCIRPFRPSQIFATFFFFFFGWGKSK